MLFGERHKKQKRKGYTFHEFMLLFPFCTKERQEELVEILANEPCPMFLGGKRVPSDLNGVSYGLLDDLHGISERGSDPTPEAIKILLGLKIEEIAKLPIEEVYGFRNFLVRELERINNLFAEIKVNYSSEEISAGVNNLSFGSFGVLDWYAKRMGITNQNEVRDVAWVRIYTCMANDTSQNNYERRLNKQYTNKMKR